MNHLHAAFGHVHIGASAAAATTKQDSRLLKLPGELKTRIYELALPVYAPIRICAERSIDAERKLTYRFSPGLPALAAVCGEVRHDFPLETYYVENTFILGEDMFEHGPGGLAAFAELRGKPAQSITKVRVSMIAILREEVGSNSFRIWFSAAASSDGKIALSNLVTSGPYLKPSALRVNEPGLCCCYLYDLADSGDATILSMLLRFSAKLRDDGQVPMLRVCECCGRVAGTSKDT